MTFETLKEYDKDLKGLRKKFRSLIEDIETLKKVLTVAPDERPPFSYRIDNLGLETCIIKVRKIACKSLKGRGVDSGIRLIYAYFEQQQLIILTEVYYKGDKVNEDRQRILKNFH